jgi:hypothetical protein
MRHYLTLERFTHSDQIRTTCECGWQSVDVTPELAELKGLAHIRQATSAPLSHATSQAAHDHAADLSARPRGSQVPGGRPQGGLMQRTAGEDAPMRGTHRPLVLWGA